MLIRNSRQKSLFSFHTSRENLNNNTYIPPPGYLKSIIRGIWQTDGFHTFGTEIIIPKGVVEILFDCGSSAPIQAALENKNYTPERCFINGINTSPIRLQLPRRQTYFGVQLHPAAIRGLFGVPAREFMNSLTELDLVHPYFDLLWHQIVEKQTFNERVAVIVRWVESKVLELHLQDTLLDHFWSTPHPAPPTVTQLANAVCYSPRQLSRKMYDLAEMNAEEALLYKKYLHAIHLIHTEPLSLTAIAFQSGFADQSHFIRTFKAYTQLTPGEYRRQKSFLQGHIFENVR